MATYLDLLNRLKESNQPDAIIYGREIYYYSGDDYRTQDGRFLSDVIGQSAMLDQIEVDDIEYYEESIPVSWLYKQVETHAWSDTFRQIVDTLVDSWRIEHHETD